MHLELFYQETKNLYTRLDLLFFLQSSNKAIPFPLDVWEVSQFEELPVLP